MNSTVVAAKNTLHDVNPWVWLLEVQLDATEALRVAGYDAEIQHAGQTYSPYPIEVGTQTNDGTGVLEGVDVTVANIGGNVGGLLESGEIQDRSTTLKLVHSANPDDVAFSTTFSVVEATASQTAVTFRLSLVQLMDAPFPGQLFARGRCRWRYGGSGCNYNLGLPNAISGSEPDFDPTTCDLTLNGSNGCSAHGRNEQANGVQVQHPALFGGFPDIPKGPARV